VLQVDSITGVVDVAIDPGNPQTMYAASYQRMRKPFGFHGGGPGSALYKSTDGGETWRKIGPLAGGRIPDAAARAGGPVAADTLGAPGPNGLPRGEYGRIGISIHRADPRIVYVSVEQGAAIASLPRAPRGTLRSEDHGGRTRERGIRAPCCRQPLVDPTTTGAST
jgi:hypothetical protein